MGRTVATRTSTVTKTVSTKSAKEEGNGRVRAANSTAERAIDILLLFNDDKPYWTANEIASHFSMPKTTVYRYVNGLRSYSLIEEDGQKGFRLGPRVFELARTAKANLTINKIALVQMQELSERFKEMIVLQQRAGDDIISIERVASPLRINLSSTRSHLLPWPATSSAKLLVAYAPEAQQNAILKLMHPVMYTPNTLKAKAALKAELEQIRNDGFSVTDEERDEGVWGVAAPIYEGDDVNYALAVAAPKFRMTEVKIKQIIEAVVEAAGKITRELEKTGF